MRNYLKVALVAMFAFFALNVNAQDDKKKDSKEAQVTFVVSIDCENCVKKVEANLPFVKGIKDFKVKLEDRTVWIKYATNKTDKEKLIKAIEEIGYQVNGEVAKK